MRTCMCLCMRMCLCSCMCACMHTARGVPVRCHCGSVGSAALHWCTVGPAAWWQVEWYLAKANAYPEVRRKKAAAQVALAKHPNPNPHANPNPNLSHGLGGDRGEVVVKHLFESRGVREQSERRCVEVCA